MKQQIELRSYLVTTAQGTICRNRRHLKYYRFQSDQDDTARYPDCDDEDIGEMHGRVPEPGNIQMPDREPESDDVQMPKSESDGIQRTRSSRVSKRPNYPNPYMVNVHRLKLTLSRRGDVVHRLKLTLSRRGDVVVLCNRLWSMYSGDHRSTC